MASPNSGKFFFSSEGGCLTSGGTERLRKFPKKSRQRRTVVSDAFGAMVRDFVSLYVFHHGADVPRGPLLADVVTGTLYEPETGLCLSGTTLRLAP